MSWNYTKHSPAYKCTQINNLESLVLIIDIHVYAIKMKSYLFQILLPFFLIKVFADLSAGQYLQ